MAEEAAVNGAAAAADAVTQEAQRAQQPADPGGRPQADLDRQFAERAARAERAGRQAAEQAMLQRFGVTSPDEVEEALAELRNHREKSQSETEKAAQATARATKQVETLAAENATLKAMLAELTHQQGFRDAAAGQIKSERVAAAYNLAKLQGLFPADTDPDFQAAVKAVAEGYPEWSLAPPPQETPAVSTFAASGRGTGQTPASIDQVNAEARRKKWTQRHLGKGAGTE